jgi:hypothetical protein
MNASKPKKRASSASLTSRQVPVGGTSARLGPCIRERSHASSSGRHAPGSSVPAALRRRNVGSAAHSRSHARSKAARPSSSSMPGEQLWAIWRPAASVCSIAVMRLSVSSPSAASAAATAAPASSAARAKRCFPRRVVALTCSAVTALKSGADIARAARGAARRRLLSAKQRCWAQLAQRRTAAAAGACVRCRVACARARKVVRRAQG